jgi:hypothetical protein
VCASPPAQTRHALAVAKKQSIAIVPGRLCAACRQPMKSPACAHLPNHAVVHVECVPQPQSAHGNKDMQ